MPESAISQGAINQELPTPEQFREDFKKIFDAETTFGSPRAAREKLLENVTDIIQEYLNHDCSIVYLHGKLREAGYTGSRKELSEWLVVKGLWTKREKVGEKAEESENDLCKVSESGEVCVSTSGTTPGAPTPTNANKNDSSAQNAVQSVNGGNHGNTKTPHKGKPNFAPPTRKTTVVYSEPLNLNPGKNQH